MTGPYLPTLVWTLASGLIRAHDHAVSTRGRLTQNLTISVSVLYETMVQQKIAIDQVEASISTTPGLAEAWAASFTGQDINTIGDDWLQVKTAMTNMYNAINSILPKAADNSVLLLTPEGSDRTLTLSPEQLEIYNGLLSAITLE